MSRALAIVAPLLLIGLILGVWEAACRLLHVPSYFLPSPGAIAEAGAANAPALLRSARACSAACRSRSAPTIQRVSASCRRRQPPTRRKG